MPKEKLKKGEVTRLAIEDTAISLFMEQGYHATSMRQIAERAELALGGIYNHFESKEDIFEAIIVDKHHFVVGWNNSIWDDANINIVDICS